MSQQLSQSAMALQRISLLLALNLLVMCQPVMAQTQEERRSTKRPASPDHRTVPTVRCPRRHF